MRFFRILRKTENPKPIHVPKRTKLILGTVGGNNYYGGHYGYYHKMVADRLIPILSEVNLLEEFVLRRQLKKADKEYLVRRIEQEFYHFDQMDWWIVNETLLPKNGLKEKVSPLRSLRHPDWRALCGLELHFKKLNPGHPLGQFKDLNRREVIQSLRIIQMLETRLEQGNVQFFFERQDPDVAKIEDKELREFRFELYKKYKGLTEEEIIEKGTKEVEKLKEEFFVKFEISLDNEELLQNVLDLQHLFYHIRIMAKQVHIQIGKKREETAEKYHFTYGYKNKKISYDPSGLVGFIQSRDPTWTGGKMKDEHLRTFESFSEEEKLKWKVEIEYPPGEVTEQIIKNKDYIALLPGHVVTFSGKREDHPVAAYFGEGSCREWKECYFNCLNSEFEKYSENKYGRKINLYSKQAILLKSKEHWQWTFTLRSKF